MTYQVKVEKEAKEGSEPREIRAGDPVRYFINIGARDDFDWMQLKDFLKETLELGRDDVFKVDVKEGFSFFNTDGEHTAKVMEVLNGFDLNGRRINVEISKNDGGGNSSRRDHNGRNSGGRREGGFRGERSSSPRREGGFGGRSESRLSDRAPRTERRGEGRTSERRSDSSDRAPRNERRPGSIPKTF